jgi:hypothetical protein
MRTRDALWKAGSASLAFLCTIALWQGLRKSTGIAPQLRVTTTAGVPLTDFFDGLAPITQTSGAIRRGPARSDCGQRPGVARRLMGSVGIMSTVLAQSGCGCAPEECPCMGCSHVAMLHVCNEFYCDGGTYVYPEWMPDATCAGTREIEAYNCSVTTCGCQLSNCYNVECGC